MKNTSSHHRYSQNYVFSEDRNKAAGNSINNFISPSAFYNYNNQLNMMKGMNHNGLPLANGAPNSMNQFPSNSHMSDTSTHFPLHNPFHPHGNSKTAQNIHSNNHSTFEQQFRSNSRSGSMNQNFNNKVQKFFSETSKNFSFLPQSLERNSPSISSIFAVSGRPPIHEEVTSYSKSVYRPNKVQNTDQISSSKNALQINQFERPLLSFPSPHKQPNNITSSSNISLGSTHITSPYFNNQPYGINFVESPQMLSVGSGLSKSTGNPTPLNVSYQSPIKKSNMHPKFGSDHLSPKSCHGEYYSYPSQSLLHPNASTPSNSMHLQPQAVPLNSPPRLISLHSSTPSVISPQPHFSLSPVSPMTLMNTHLMPPPQAHQQSQPHSYQPVSHQPMHHIRTSTHEGLSNPPPRNIFPPSSSSQRFVQPRNSIHKKRSSIEEFKESVTKDKKHYSLSTASKNAIDEKKVFSSKPSCVPINSDNSSIAKVNVHSIPAPQNPTLAAPPVRLVGIDDLCTTGNSSWAPSKPKIKASPMKTPQDVKVVDAINKQELDKEVPPAKIPPPPPPPKKAAVVQKKSADVIPNTPTSTNTEPSPTKQNCKASLGNMIVCQNCGISEERTSEQCSRCKRNPHKTKQILKPPTIICRNQSEPKSSNISSTSGSVNSNQILKKKENLLPQNNKISKECEPEIFTLSSDDEEHSKVKRMGNCKQSDDFSLEKSSALSGGGKSTSSREMNYDDQSMSLTSECVRVGTYEAVPNGEISLSHTGIVIPLPSASKGGGKVNLKLFGNRLLKITANLKSATMSMMFIYVRPTFAASISKTLKFEENSKFILNPTSKNIHEHLIILYLEPLTPEEVSKIMKFYKGGNYSKDFLHLIDDSETNYFITKYVKEESENPVEEAKTLLIYPPQQNSGGITITTDDFSCLSEEQFLNDVILDFYLKYLLLDKLSARDCDRTHVFSTFFYKRLTSKQKKCSAQLTPSQKRHSRVKSWTKNIDIFRKDFIIVPINDRSHWFLAVICFPGLSGPVDFESGLSIQANVSNNSYPRKFSSVKVDNKPDIPLVDDLEWSDKDEAEGEDEEMGGGSEEERAPKKPRTDLPPIKQPCILIFDSLSGSSRSRIVATLRDYLTQEYLEKKKSKKIFSRENMKGVLMTVPQQNNFSDCGIFTLQFAESFFERPIKDFRFPIPKLSHWFSENRVKYKREEISNLIESLIAKYRPDQDIALPLLQFNSRESVSPPPEATPEETPTEEPKEVVVEEQQPNQNVDLEEEPAEEIFSPPTKRIKINIVDKGPRRPAAPVPFLHEGLAPSAHLHEAITSKSISVQPVCVLDDEEEVKKQARINQLEHSKGNNSVGQPNDRRTNSLVVEVIESDPEDEIIFDSHHIKSQSPAKDDELQEIVVHKHTSRFNRPR